MKKKYQTILVVGRFQPFHKGHLYLLKTALNMSEQVVVAIGSANSTDKKRNPFSYEQRKEMLEMVIENQGWGSRIAKIVPSFDFPSDEKWLSSLLENVGDFDLAVGNNDWTNSVIQEAGYEATTIPFRQRDIFQGVHIRELIRSNSEWQERVPEYLVEFVRENLV